MPYRSTRELPDSTKKMPAHAKRIWMSAFNAASKQYDKEEQAFAVAFAAVKRLYRQDDKGTWHRMKEAEAVPDIDAWLETNLAEIISAADLPDDEPDTLTEAEHPRHGLRHASEFLACELCEFTPEERTMLAAMVGRMAKATASEEPPATNMGYLESYQAQGPQLAHDAYRLLVSLAPSLDEPLVPSLLEALTPLLPQDADTSALPDATPAQAKEALEALKVWDLRMGEAGQRHAAWEYSLIDSILDSLKKLRGLTPAEMKAIQTETAHDTPAIDETPETPQTLVAQGYRESLPPGSHTLELTEAVILQERDGTDGSEWEVSIIQSGLSKNARLYPLEVLRQSAPLFEGARVYAYDRLLKGKEIFDHLSDAELQANPQGYARDLVGFLKAPRVDGSRLVATLHVLDGAGWLRDNLRDAFRHGQSSLYGLSIDAEGDGHMAESGGQQVLHVDTIRRVRSVDVVSHPAAGGAFLRLVAGLNVLEVERQIESTVQALTREMQQMAFRHALDDAMDEAEVPIEVRRRFRARILAALPS